MVIFTVYEDLQYLTQITETKSIPGKISGNSRIVHFAEIYQAVPLPLLNVASYCKSSNSKACIKKLSQILANNIDNERGGWSQNLCKVVWYSPTLFDPRQSSES